MQPGACGNSYTFPNAFIYQPMMASEVLTRDGLKDSNLNHDGIRDSDLNLQVPHLQFSQASLAGDGGQELGFTSHEFATKFPSQHSKLHRLPERSKST
jgi:hypothetical protein